jgi:ubiquinone/menaquinone biosynthesis C-methylase UbiE
MSERALLEEQYRTPSNLRARSALYERFAKSSQPYREWVFDGYEIGERADVLEVGCGDGMVWRENADRIPSGWRLTLTDLSRGMLEAARAVLGDRAEYAVADVEELPFEDDSFDSVIANHMLFHIEARERAFSQIRRVLRPGGLLLATTNGKTHGRELRELAPPREGIWSKTRERFTLESAPDELAPFFVEIAIERYPASLAVTETAPLVAFLRSRGDVSEERLGEIARHVDDAIARDGAFVVTQDAGRVRCRKP